ncbi:LysR family transcriptional regulator [Catenovulum agarivorans]|uniref:LysR family transcriptional regulator n=1 Tax=Catenovulum agarivorans TaxID=1172192 RepID=UPI000475082F|nr:LysR family transcriptional regulator [Catenovulum agarivorans]
MNWNSIKFDWNHIRSFLATAEEGSLSAAAKALGLTQPTLSRQIYALEAELKLMLFERVGQRLVLTESGVELLQHARSMGDEALKFSLAVTGQSQQLEGRVTLSVSELTATYVLPKILRTIRQLEPGIRIEVVVTNNTSDLKKREADIAIRSYYPKQNDLIAKKLGQEVIWLYGTAEYLQGFSAASKLSELTDIQIIGFDDSNTVIDILNQQGWALSQKNFSLLTSFQPLQIELCKQGQGLVFMPEDMGNREPNLVKAFADMGATMTLDVWLVSHQELRTSLRVRRVFDLIAQQYSSAVMDKS